jgi:hypothetical protein
MTETINRASQVGLLLLFALLVMIAAIKVIDGHNKQQERINQSEY